MTKDLPAESPKQQKARTIQVEVRRRHRGVVRSPLSMPATPKCPPAGSYLDEEGADTKLTEKSATGDHLPALPPAEPAEALPFIPLDQVPYEPARWQAVGLLKKTSVTVLVVPPGAAGFALCAFFVGYLSGRMFGPFGPARYPGDVLFSTHTRDLDRSLRAAVSAYPSGQHKVLTQLVNQRFNWREPVAGLKDALKGRPRGSTAAVILDAGPVPQRLDEASIGSAHDDLSQMAEGADCLVLLVVESTNTHADPFQRIPRSLRFLRGTLLAAPLRSKALTPQPHDPAQFLLLRLAEANPSTLAVSFTVMPTDDAVETSKIWWGDVGFGDPREVFRRAETIDLSKAQRIAVQLAAEIILGRGPTSSKDLQAAGKLTRGIPPTTMRDALSVAHLLGHLACARSMFDGTRYWIIPGVTQLGPGMYIPGEVGGDHIPF